MAMDGNDHPHLRRGQKDRSPVSPDNMSGKTRCFLGGGLFLCLLVFLLGPAPFLLPPARAGIIMLQGPGGTLWGGVKSLKELRFRFVVRQRYDFSCGSAAVATLLTYEYRRKTSEAEAFKYMWNSGDRKKIQKIGFSLLDMKKFLSSLGYEADGYQVPLDVLKKNAIPAIVLIEVNGYKHFVVIEGMNRREVLVGDPALGLRKMKIQDFRSVWKNKIVFIIHRGPRILITRQTYNDRKGWEIVNVKVPFHLEEEQQTLANQVLVIPGPNQFQFGGFSKIGVP